MNKAVKSVIIFFIVLLVIGVVSEIIFYHHHLTSFWRDEAQASIEKNDTKEAIIQIEEELRNKIKDTEAIRKIDAEEELRNKIKDIEEAIRKIDADREPKKLPFELDKLVRGKIAYKIPDIMDIGKNHKATVSIAKVMNDSILLHGFHQENFQVEEISVSSRVKVYLKDPTEKKFKIIPLNTDEQLVDDSTNTFWEWNIIPIRGGYNMLELRVTVKVFDQLGETYKDIPVFYKTIKVNASIPASIKHFIGNYWQWLLTFIFGSGFLSGLGIWCYKILSNRRDKNTDRKRKTKNKKKRNTK